MYKTDINIAADPERVCSELYSSQFNDSYFQEFFLRIALKWIGAISLWSQNVSTQDLHCSVMHKFLE